MNKKKSLLFILFMWLSVIIYAQNNTDEKPKENPNFNFERTFMPGAGYGFYLPKKQDSIGVFSGVIVEFLIYGKVAQNNYSGPSHIRTYGKLNLMSSSKANVSDLFMYSFGLDMSLERNPKRTFLIPYFGIEIGGISQKTLGTTFQFTPIMGVHLLSRQNIFINLQGGYVYPVNNFDVLQGYILKSTVNFSLW